LRSSKRHDRVSQLYRLLTAKHQPRVSLDRICEELECSESTGKRLIRDLRERYSHPIEYDRDRAGYFYDRENLGGAAVELPGLWFTESELRALVIMRHLLQSIDSVKLGQEIAPFGQKIEELLASIGADAGEVARRIRIVGIAERHVDGPVFRASADAVLQRRQLAFTYTPRSRPIYEAERRTVCPQRLVHYRDNWYLDAWCHNRKALRIFALDQMEEPHILEPAARDIDDAELDAVLKSGYGIFAGEPTATALLRFSPERAQWVSKEIWHGKQSGRFLLDGSWEVAVPYSIAHELVMDIMKHGVEVEVLAPASLRKEVAAAHAKAAKRYETEG
jgi:proteasome accessory factor C